MFTSELTIKSFSEIKQIKTVWQSLYASNQKLTIFQSYEWNLILHNQLQHPINRIQKLVKGRLHMDYLLMEADGYQVIAPLVVNTTEKSIAILGQQSVSDYLSFIYSSEASPIILHRTVKYIIDKYREFNFVFDRINEGNHEMAEALVSCTPKRVIRKNCVKIPIPGCDQYFSGLSKDAHRYISQANKRLIANKIEARTNFGLTPIDSRTANELYHHFLLRNYHKFNVPFSRRFFNVIKSPVKRRIKYNQDVVSEYFLAKQEAFLAECYLGNELAAYFLCEQRGSVMYVVRISISDYYKDYRPGILLLTETIRFLATSGKISYLDLTRGDESYKVNFGGEIHHNYLFEFNLQTG